MPRSSLLLPGAVLALQLIQSAAMAAEPAVKWAVPWPVPGQVAEGYPVLKEVEHYSIYRATPETGLFSHHAQIAYLRGVFYVSWSSHRTGEDGPGQRILCSTSRDGKKWTQPFECLPGFDEPKDPKVRGRVLTAIAWADVNGAAYVVADVDDRVGKNELRKSGVSRDESTPEQPYMGRYGWGRVARLVNADGNLGAIFWLVANPPPPVPGFPVYPGANHPDYRTVAKKVSARFDDPLNLPAWDFHTWGHWTFGKDGHMLCEPTVYRRPDGVLVKLSRDRNDFQSYRLYASLSFDNGRYWTEAERTNIPDSPSKSTSGSLPDGRIYLIGNQISRESRGHRDPLVLSLSADGKTFNQAFAIRSGAPAVRTQGSAKGRGFQYPSAVVAQDSLWVIYSVGKEDVDISRVPLAALPPPHIDRSGRKDGWHNVLNTARN